MTSAIPPHLFVEPVVIEAHAGQGAYGDTYADAVTVLGHIAGGRNTGGGVVLRRSGGAEELVSDMRLLLPNPARLVDAVSREVVGTVDPTTILTPESRVTAGTVVATVGKVEPFKVPGRDVVVYVSGELT